MCLLVGFCQVFACNGVEWAILQNDTGSGKAYCNYLQLRMLVNVGAIRKSNVTLSIVFVK
jgi:hypothetical protein